MSDEMMEITETRNIKEQHIQAVLERQRDEFGFLGIMSVIFGVIGAVCLHKNTMGIGVFFFVAVAYGGAWYILKKKGKQIKRGSYFLVAVSLLTGLSTAFTGEAFLGFFMNRMILGVLFCIFLLHQCYEDREWNIGKYAGAVCTLLLQTVGMSLVFFGHFKSFVQSVKSQRYKTVIAVLGGFCASIPMLIFLSVFLASADRVFDNMLYTLIDSYLNPFSVIGWVVSAAFWAVCMYALTCAVRVGGIREAVTDRRRGSAAWAISFMGMIALLYLVFCGIQVVYLFLRQGNLPDGEWITYSNYAREGFFQLLFVASLNLVMVLLCLKYVKKHLVLDGVLIVISLCTYIMIASAAYRMILYIEQYQLTFLRVLVLWSLVVIAVLMAGVIVLIFNNHFPLFRYFLVTVSLFYLALVWAKPDYVAARYNIACWEQTEEGMTEERIWYLESLSCDGAAAVKKMKDESAREEILQEYRRKGEKNGWGGMKWNRVFYGELGEES